MSLKYSSVSISSSCSRITFVLLVPLLQIAELLDSPIWIWIMKFLNEQEENKLVGTDGRMATVWTISFAGSCTKDEAFWFDCFSVGGNNTFDVSNNYYLLCYWSFISTQCCQWAMPRSRSLLYQLLRDIMIFIYQKHYWLNVLLFKGSLHITLYLVIHLSLLLM